MNFYWAYMLCNLWFGYFAKSILNDWLFSRITIKLNGAQETCTLHISVLLLLLRRFWRRSDDYCKKINLYLAEYYLWTFDCLVYCILGVFATYCLLVAEYYILRVQPRLKGRRSKQRALAEDWSRGKNGREIANVEGRGKLREKDGIKTWELNRKIICKYTFFPRISSQAFFPFNNYNTIFEKVSGPDD